MKITRNSLKELIRQSIKELDFKDKEAFDKYDKKHKMKADTKVSIGGKDTTVGQAIDVGGPSHANVPTKKKGKKAGPGKDKYGREEPFLVPGAGDPGDVGIGDLPDPSTRRGKDDDEFDVGGPAYPNVPKGAKTSKQAKQMKKNDEIASNIGYSNSKDLMSGGMADEVEEYIDTAYGDNADWDKIQARLDYIRDAEMGVGEDSDWKAENAREEIEKILSKTEPGGANDQYVEPDTGVDDVPYTDDDEDHGGGGDVGDPKWDPEIDKTAMGAADDANAKMDKDELDGAYKQAEKLKKALSATDDPKKEKAIAAKINKYWNDVIYPLEKKVHGKNESVKESTKPKRFTVKEIRKWMKTLEENRYKRVYNSDARRVSWMANNNLSEDYESMPISMRKKWSKAQYGRERYLAKEFLKTKTGEQKLKEAIRNIVKGLITEQTLNEAVGSYKSVFDYNAQDPQKAGRSFEEMFDGAEGGYSESWDTYGWNEDKNWQKAVDEYHKEMFKLVDEHIKTVRKAEKFYNTKDKIFKKWRKTDGSKAGD